MEMSIEKLGLVPLHHQYSKDELNFIAKHLKKEIKVRVLYGFAKEGDKKLVVVYDFQPYSSKKAKVINLWQIVSDREISEQECHWLAADFMRRKRRFIVYKYDDLNSLMESDILYRARTPYYFIKACQEKYPQISDMKVGDYEFNDSGVCLNGDVIFHFMKEGSLAWDYVELRVATRMGRWFFGYNVAGAGSPCMYSWNSVYTSKDVAIEEGIKSIKAQLERKRGCTKNHSFFRTELENWIASRTQLSLFG